jgi:type I restriction enzyme M protein
MVASLNENGRMGVVLPHGILFRSGAEGTIREGLLRDDLVEAVIGLANNLFYGTGIPACVLVLNRNKPQERKGKVLIVNGEKEFKEGKNQNSLSDENVQRMVGAFKAFADEEMFARVVELDEIAGNDWNLNIARYVDTNPPAEKIDTAAELRKLKELTAQRDAAEAVMMRYLEELGYE